MAGDVTPDEAMPLVESAFAGWPQGEAPDKDLGAPRTSGVGRVYLMDKPDAPQPVIVAAEASHPGGRPEDLAMETVMRLFGGMSTSRLNRNLRLDKHWSYGVRGMLLDARGPRPFLVIAPVQTDKTKEAMLELRDEIRGIAGGRPVQGEEFENIRRNMVLRLPGRFETLSSLESAATDIVNYGYPPEYFYDYATHVRGLTEDDLVPE